MKINALHDWNVDIREAMGLQERLREHLITSDTPGRKSPKTVAGADISYSKHSDQFFAVVLLFS